MIMNECLHFNGTSRKSQLMNVDDEFKTLLYSKLNKIKFLRRFSYRGDFFPQSPLLSVSFNWDRKTLSRMIVPRSFSDLSYHTDVHILLHFETWTYSKVDWDVSFSGEIVCNSSCQQMLAEI